MNKVSRYVKRFWTLLIVSLLLPVKAFAASTDLAGAFGTINNQIAAGGTTVQRFLMLAGIVLVGVAGFGIKQAKDRNEPIGGHLTTLDLFPMEYQLKSVLLIAILQKFRGKSICQYLKNKPIYLIYIKGH